VRNEHPIRGRVNAWLLAAIEIYVHRALGRRKARLFGGLTGTLVEIGAGNGPNFRYLPRGTRVHAIEPNAPAHPLLARRAHTHGIELRVHACGAEAIDLPDASVDGVYGSWVLCSAGDPARVLGEVRRVLKPGRPFAFLEHVAAPHGSAVCAVQRAVRGPWRWFFEGCRTDADTAALVRAAGFSAVDIEPFTLRVPLVPVRPQIAGTAVR
jgi:ubiquinone/menaquinone biosynthesis C-methylase UbiE